MDHVDHQIAARRTARLPRALLLLLLLVAGLAAASPPAHAASTAAVVSQVYARRRQQRRDVRERLRRALQPRRGRRRPHRLDGPVRDGRRHLVAGDDARRDASLPVGYYLVQLASAGAVGAALPTPDATGTTNLAASGGKVALVRDATALTCGAPPGAARASRSSRTSSATARPTDYEGAGAGARARQHVGRAARARRLHGHRRERRRLHGRDARSAQLGVAATTCGSARSARAAIAGRDRRRRRPAGALGARSSDTSLSFGQRRRRQHAPPRSPSASPSRATTRPATR